MPVWQSMQGQRYCGNYAAHGAWVQWPCEEGEVGYVQSDDRQKVSLRCSEGEHQACTDATCGCTDCDCAEW